MTMPWKRDAALIIVALVAFLIGLGLTAAKPALRPAADTSAGAPVAARTSHMPAVTVDPASVAVVPEGRAGVVPPSAPTGHIADAIIGGRASWVRASLGSRYLAMRLPKGTRVRICGEQGCVQRLVNDYGPSSRIRPSRIADLSSVDFIAICGPLSMGVCRVQVTLLERIELPATDTE